MVVLESYARIIFCHCGRLEDRNVAVTLSQDQNTRTTGVGSLLIFVFGDGITYMIQQLHGRQEWIVKFE